MDYLTWSAHKHYGPKGVGALYCSPNARQPAPLLLGGGQENNLRSGTVNVAGAVGMAAALEECITTQVETLARLEILTQQLRDGLAALSLPCPLVINTPCEDAIPGILHVSVMGNEGPIQGESLLLQLDLLGIAASSGSACHAAALEPSRILHVMMVGLDNERPLTTDELARATGTLRFSLGRHTTPNDVAALLAALPKAVSRLVKTPSTLLGAY